MPSTPNSNNYTTSAVRFELEYIVDRRHKQINIIPQAQDVWVLDLSETMAYKMYHFLLMLQDLHIKVFKKSMKCHDEVGQQMELKYNIANWNSTDEQYSPGNG